MIELLDFTTEDYGNIYAFMRPLWLTTYGEILPTEQIEFLLEKYFSKEGLAHYRALGYRYRKIGEIGVLVTVEKEKELYIDKLYLLPSARGMGIPREIFQELQKSGKDLTLNVNRANERAVKCYLKNGFQIERETEILLDNGMINCDYEMRLKTKKSP